MGCIRFYAMTIFEQKKKDNEILQLKFCEKEINAEIWQFDHAHTRTQTKM